MVKRGLIIGGIIPLLWSFSAFAEGADFSVDVDNAVLELNVPASAEINLNPTSTGSALGTTDLNVFVATNNSTGYSYYYEHT